MKWVIRTPYEGGTVIYLEILYDDECGLATWWINVSNAMTFDTKEEAEDTLIRLMGAYMILGRDLNRLALAEVVAWHG